MSSHRVNVETGRWQKPTAIPFNERTQVCKCIELKISESKIVLKNSQYRRNML